MFSSQVFGSSERSNDVTDFEIEMAAQAFELIVLNTTILSRADLLKHLQRSTDADSPLYALSSEGLESFIDSLVFTSQGLASWRYDVLVNELTDRGIYEVMRLFGKQYHTSYVDKRLLTPEEQLIRAATTGGDVGGIGDGALDDKACATPICVPLEFSTCDPEWCADWP